MDGMIITLRERVLRAATDKQRSLYDLVLAIALFVPEKHELAIHVHKCLDSMVFAPPENHHLYLMRLLESFMDIFPDDKVLYSPWWVRVICILLTAGDGATTKLIASFNVPEEKIR